MERVKEPMFRYGDPEFDREYLRLGYHERVTRIQEADSVLRVVGGMGKSLSILDLGCGTGAHAIHWSCLGHRVTGVDLSQTFIDECRRRCGSVGVSFEVGDIRSLPYQDAYDVVTWIEPTFFDEHILRAICGYLKPGGTFIFDIRNPEHPQMKRITSNWRSWKDDGQIFHLEKHETDIKTGLRHSEWIEIDILTGTVTEKLNTFRPVKLEDRLKLLRENGFPSFELRTMSGEVFRGGSDDYWLWVVGKREV